MRKAKPRQMFRMTADGLSELAMSFTGDKARSRLAAPNTALRIKPESPRSARAHCPPERAVRSPTPMRQFAADRRAAGSVAGLWPLAAGVGGEHSSRSATPETAHEPIEG